MKKPEFQKEDILSFIEKALLTQLQEIEEWGHKKRDDVDKDLYCRNETNDWKNGYDCAMIDLLSALKEKKDKLNKEI